MSDRPDDPEIPLAPFPTAAPANPFPPLEGEARAAALEAALAKYRLVEDALFKGPWVMGDDYTVADGYLSVFTRWGRQAGFLDPARFPTLNDHLDRMQARPAVQRVLEAEGLSAV